jgi:hypothetical protein
LDWVAYQSSSLLWLDRIPIVGPIVQGLDETARRVNHRRWQVFLRCLFAFSIFTIPIQLFQWIDDPVAWALSKLIELADLHWLTWLTATMVGFGELYGLLIDWVITILLLFAVASILSALEPENLFLKVKDALDHFSRKGKPFRFTCYFWQHEPGRYAATPSWPDDEVRRPLWEATARVLHDEALQLDRWLPATWQGVNSRVSAVFEDQSGEKGETYCLHYRRFGQSAYLAAVGSSAGRFEGGDIVGSQSDFLQLSESIGLLVNVRHSLKQGIPNLVRRAAR